jgi:hypothetical protein
MQKPKIFIFKYSLKFLLKFVRNAFFLIRPTAPVGQDVISRHVVWHSFCKLLFVLTLHATNTLNSVTN